VALAGLAAPVLRITTLSVLDPTVRADELVLPAFCIGAAWGAGRLVNRRQELARRMAALAAALEQQQQENARLAAEAERHRIAREVHDIVAQSLGVILIQAEPAQELLDHGGATERPVAVIRSTAGEPLEELRGVLGGVRASQPSPQVGVETFKELIERFRRVTNQLHALTVTAPPALREQLEGRTTRARVLMRRVAGGEGGRGQLAGGPVRTEVGVSVVGGRLRSRGLPGR
jgi:signal transduction histidine kinase